MRKTLGIIASLSIMVAGLFVSAPVFAGECSGGNQDASCNKVCSDPKIAQEIKDAAGCSNTSDDLVTNNIESIINVAITVVGILAVLVIVVGGQRLVTSSGDPGKIKQAKDMILYAAIALIIAGLAYAVVTFVGTSIGK